MGTFQLSCKVCQMLLWRKKRMVSFHLLQIYYYYQNIVTNGVTLCSTCKAPSSGSHFFLLSILFILELFVEQVSSRINIMQKTWPTSVFYCIQWYHYCDASEILMEVRISLPTTIRFDTLWLLGLSCRNVL